MGYLWQLTTAVMGGVVLAALPIAAPEAEVLVYKGSNKWVAAEDNKPLLALFAEARGGKLIYQVRLPVEGRALAITRLEIVRDRLEKEAGKPVVMQEAGGSAKAGTVEVW